ncbi:MAG: aminotransferase class V-fold PLP-dependent enzyme [Clostridiales bacterium]|nr:aminotransferase class V-fold PLP-dependent enzyme [Clostridiales bacterium]
MIYLDNAATTYPKPRAVISEISRSLITCGGNPGRAGHALSLASSGVVYDARVGLCEFFGVKDERNAVFTKNDTEALCLSIFGLIPKNSKVITTNIEHNSVRRPLEKLARERGVIIHTLDATKPDDALLSDFESAIDENTSALVCLHASNICPRVLPIKELGALCRAHNIKFILDAAQSAGIYDIDVDGYGIDALCVPGHKGLFGPMGSGAVIFRDGFDFDAFEPLIFGGTGTYSRESDVGREPPESYESGTLSVPAIAGLAAGIKYVKSLGTGYIRAHDCALYEMAKSGLLSLGATLYGDFCAGSVLSFSLDGIPDGDVDAYLSQNDICVRAGLHCAPTAHNALGCGDGSVRISFSPMNTERDVKDFLRTLGKMRK